LHLPLEALAAPIVAQNLIDPRTLKGFRDYLPEAMIPREKLMETARRVYQSFGFSPIDTPALEYFEILNGKGGEESDRLLYNFQDQGGRHVGMRFDLTVPLARFVAQHHNDLGTPFKRYHIGPVWRGENTHKGRYREFVQCDFDTIGSKGVMADIETGVVIHELLSAIGFDRFTIRINNRQILKALLTQLDLSDKTVAVLRSLDKLGKIGREKVIDEMGSAAGISPEKSAQVLDVCTISGDSDSVLSSLAVKLKGNELGEAGVERLSAVISGMKVAGVSAERAEIDVSIARGLDYYTGMIFETFLGDLPGIGSVCSGGRYDNLAGLFTKVELPGIGASLGLDRLLAAMQELKLIEPIRTPAPVLIVFFDKNLSHEYLKIASWIRSAGIGCEIFPDPIKVGQQLSYADRRGHSIALVMGDREFASGLAQVKHLASRQTSEASIANNGAAIVATVQSLLKPA
jgi:histidyl-tRNA synthetase